MPIERHVVFGESGRGVSPTFTAAQLLRPVKLVLRSLTGLLRRSRFASFRVRIALWSECAPPHSTQ